MPQYSIRSMFIVLGIYNFALASNEQLSDQITLVRKSFTWPRLWAPEAFVTPILIMGFILKWGRILVKAFTFHLRVLKT